MNTATRLINAKLTAVVLAAFFVGAGAQNASSQPGRTIKVVITFPAGSGGDVLTWAMSEEITRARSPRFTFDNTDQFSGAEAVAQASPDGNTLLVINNNFTVNAKLQKPLRDVQQGRALHETV